MQRNKLQIVCKTWGKLSHSLYDYQTDKIVTKHFVHSLNSSSITIFRHQTNSQVYSAENKLQSIETVQNEPFQAILFIRILKNVSSCLIKLQNPLTNRANQGQKAENAIQNERQKKQQEQQAYFVLNNFSGDVNSINQRLMPGMTMKLGRNRYYVSEWGNGVQTIKKDKLSHWQFTRRQYTFKSPASNEWACKICMQRTQTKDNFIFNPCRCKQELGAVHLQCLTNWIQMKTKLQIIGATTHYFFSTYQCQICMTELPGYVKTEQKRHQILSFERPKTPYLILQSSNEHEHTSILLKNASEPIMLGRAHQCDIRITDISISRRHAIISCKGAEFFIADNKSKFGTLVAPSQMNFQLLPATTVRVQVGRTVIQFSLISSP